jgi:DNA-directed RNA polymerase specialized sigma24 family protein
MLAPLSHGLDEAIVILFGAPSPGRDRAYGIVAPFLASRARQHGARDPEDIAQQVLIKLMTRAQGGETPWTNPAAGKAYLAKCAERAAIDEHRREQRHSGLSPDLIPGPGPLLDGDERALVEKVAAVARSRRAPRYRAEFDATWSQLSALVFEDADLRELLQAEGALDQGSSEADFVKARNRAYKNHERVRDALRAAAGEMRNTGQLSADDAELALACLRVLVRCQRSELRSVSPSRKEGS